MSVFLIKNAMQFQSPLYYGYQQTNSKIYMESQNVHNNQHNIKEEQGSRTDTSQLNKRLIKQH